MSNEIRRVPDDEVDGDEAWIRESDEPDLRLVEATCFEDQWQVSVAVAELLREEPLEGELRRNMASALTNVPGVTGVFEEDREVWAVDGSPSGEALVQAAAAVVDALADRARTHIDSL